MIKPSLEYILKEAKLVDEEQWNRCLEGAKDNGEDLFSYLLTQEFIDESSLLAVLAPHFNLVFEPIDKATVDYRIASIIPESLARSRYTVPLFQLGDHLSVAVSNPFDLELIEEIESISKLEVNPVLTPKSNIEQLFSYCYSFRDHGGETSSLSNLFDMGIKLVDERGSGLDEQAIDLGHEAPIAKLIDSILHQAIAENASDIHVEPEEGELKIRFRVDGMMKDIMSPPKKLESAIISRIKILANLDITETRKPQDGRITVQIKERDIDLRISTVRTISGEKIVLRILDKSGAFVSLDKLGLTPNNFKIFQSLISSTSGIIVVCGPTGSGKTSTLYSALSFINSPDKNIITIEDPVEFNLEGINQIPVNQKIGVDFITGLKAVLRQDPDIIMIGEVRDYETANIAIQSALTGHLVLTTLHTRSASGAITRLVDMGAQPFLLNSAILGILGQRLARTICPNCKEPASPDQYRSVKQVDFLREMEGLYKQIRLFKGSGCKFCDNRGYKGRTGVFEILVMTEELRELVASRASIEKIQKTACEQGMVTMRGDAFQKVMGGLITLDEVARILDV